MVFDFGKLKFFHDIVEGHAVWKVLFVCEYENATVGGCFIFDYAEKFVACFAYAGAITGIDEEKDSVGAVEKCCPSLSEGGLTCKVPALKSYVPAFNCFHV